MKIIISSRQRLVAFDLSYIRRIAEHAYPFCLKVLRSKSAPLVRLSCLDVVILSDRQMGRVHAEFLGDSEPTDVITFHHGEILLGAGVINGNACKYKHTPTQEAALCVIHGLLHLAGWLDQKPSEAHKMAAKQEQIFKMAKQKV